MANQSTSQNPMISLISVCYKRHDLLNAYLRCISEHEPRNDMEIIVVDVCGNEDSVVAWYDEYLLTETRVCYSKAVNMGLRKSRGEYIVWGNEDLLVSGPFLDELITPIKENKHTLTGERLGKQDGHTFIPGWLVAMHRDALVDIGYLDERFPGTFEDVEYCVRAQNMNYRLVKVDVPVKHLHLGRLNKHLFTGLEILRGMQ